jgi:beta-N-acetylhexosaminidase
MPRFTGPRRRSIPLVLLAIVVSACGSSQPSALPSATTSTVTPSPTTASPSPTPSATPDCVQQTFDALTDDQRVGQLFALGLANDQLGPAEVEAIQSHHFGSVTFVVTTSEGVDSVRATTDAVQALATGDATGKVGFLVGANQEGGQIQALRGPGFSTIPSAVEQGKMDPATLKKDATTWGRQLVSAGVNWNYAPVMDVVPPGTDAQNQPIGVLQREFGHDPTTVARQGVAFLHGMDKAGVVPTAKHFPGLGRVEGNTDFTADVVDDVTTSDDPYLQSFQAAIDAGVPFVMVALATYTRIDPNHLAVFSPTVISLLRDQLGFGGVVLSDEIGAAEAVQSIPAGDRAKDFLAAGGDMIISKTIAPAVTMAKALLSRMAKDDAFRARVDDAVHQVLVAKMASGLLPCGGS